MMRIFCVDKITFANGVGPKLVKSACHCGKPKCINIMRKYVEKFGAK